MLAARLGEITGLPVIELDRLFWQPGLAAMSPGQWAAFQRRLARRQAWIMDGDLGPYDVVGVRLAAADTVIVLDFPLLRCAWRAIHRSRERGDFWCWLFTYRRRSRPVIRQAIATHAPRCRRAGAIQPLGSQKVPRPDEPRHPSALTPIAA